MPTVAERVMRLPPACSRLDPAEIRPRGSLRRRPGLKACSRSSWWRCSKRNSASRWTRTPPCRSRPSATPSTFISEDLQGARRSEIEAITCHDEETQSPTRWSIGPSPNLSGRDVQLRSAAADPFRRADRRIYRRRAGRVRSGVGSRPATSSSPTRPSATGSRPGRPTRSSRWSTSTICWRSLGGPNGVIRQTEFFLYTKQRSRDAGPLPGAGPQLPECTGWIRADKGDFRLVSEAGLKETGMLTSCSDYHIFQKLKFKSRKRVHGRLLRRGRRRVRGRHPPAATWKTSPGPTSTASCCPSSSG